jgi:undecaprenyl-diphosphatase
LELIKAMVLGIVQGLTEFLPISSSGHLVIGSKLMNFQEQGVVFDVFVHLGTLLAVVVVFRKELIEMIKAPFALLQGDKSESVRNFFFLDVYIIVATLPAVAVGLFLKDSVESLFGNIMIVYLMLIVTGIIMIISRYLPQKDKPITWGRSLLVGCAQACAILPGLSRSGSTIFAGMVLGIDREKIARFSFIMSIPAILGAAMLQLGDFMTNPLGSGALVNIGAGAVMAAVSGYFAIKLLLDIIRRNRLQWFGYYCLLISATGIGHYLFIAA